MRSRRFAMVSLTTAILAMVVAVVGFIVALVLNTFFLDKYDAYGEVPIPGSSSLYLPAGEATVSFHTVVIGSRNGGQPVVTESVGSTTTVNNDAHIRVWVAHIPVSGTYNVTTDGKVNGYIEPRLAFGH